MTSKQAATAYSRRQMRAASSNRNMAALHGGAMTVATMGAVASLATGDLALGVVGGALAGWNYGRKQEETQRGNAKVARGHVVDSRIAQARGGSAAMGMRGVVPGRRQLPGMMRLGGPMPAAPAAGGADNRRILKGIGKLVLGGPTLAAGIVQTAARAPVIGVPTVAAGVGLIGSGMRDITGGRTGAPADPLAPGVAKGVAKMVAGAPTFVAGAVESLLGVHTLGVPTMLSGAGLVISGMRDIAGARRGAPAAGAFRNASAAAANHEFEHPQRRYAAAAPAQRSKYVDNWQDSRGRSYTRHDMSVRSLA